MMDMLEGYIPLRAELVVNLGRRSMRMKKFEID